jgi:succinyl-diaminopimelate desuccinylase
MHDRIDAFVEANADAMIEDIKKLIAIRSVRGDAEPGMPYGRAVNDALVCARNIAETAGLNAENVAGCMLDVNLNDREDVLGILCHLDVVPEGTGWTTPPFEGHIRDGRIYGRGAADNKGPAVAAIYALRCVKELGAPLSKNVRLMLGTDEENGSSDLKAYTKIKRLPPFCFSPDAAFPVYNIEKGRYAGAFASAWAPSDALPRILSVDGGSAVNVVPDEATAVIAGMDAETVRPFAAAFAEASGVDFDLGETADGCRIEAKGLGTHASFPEFGRNAVTALIGLLAGMPFADSEGFERLKSVNALLPHGDFSGTALGVAMSDELSGSLTLNLGVFHFGDTGLKGEFDARCPLCSTEENTSRVIASRFAALGLTVGHTEMILPHHVPEDLPFIATLLGAYEEVTGMKGECVAMGGGTYIHGYENCVAFGAAYPETETYAHAADEYSVIEELKANIKIYVRVILRMCA